MTVAEAAERYGAAPRTVKRWRATGRERDDPCPLEDPEKMLGWWQRNMVQRIPDGINLAVIAARRRSEPKAEPEPKAVVATPEPEPESEPGGVESGEVGMAAELARLELLAWKLAKLADQPGQTKPYLDTLARMSTISEKLRTEAEREGRLLPRDLVEDTLRGFHAVIEREFRGQYRAMCELLEIVPTAKREQQWNEVCDGLFERMGQEVLR